jgi:hypothetical protein
MKKSLVFAMIAVFALSIFAVGCKKEEAAPETTTEAAPAVVETAPAVDTAMSTDTAATTETTMTEMTTMSTSTAPATTDTAAAPATK